MTLTIRLRPGRRLHVSEYRNVGFTVRVLTSVLLLEDAIRQDFQRLLEDRFLYVLGCKRHVPVKTPVGHNDAVPPKDLREHLARLNQSMRREQPERAGPLPKPAHLPGLVQKRSPGAELD